jgi:putative peptidoglycan lipid II flippase
VLVPCFYALGKPRTPLRISLIGIGVNLALNLIGFEVLHLGHAGLALTTSCVALVNFAQLAFALRKHIDIGDAAQWASYLARCLLASVACGVAAWAVDRRLEPVFRHGALAIVALAIAVGAGVATYFAIARLLRLSESAQAWRMIRRRLPGGARG